MKSTIKLLIISLFLSSYVSAQTPCPIKGDKSNLKFEHLDSLKNRSHVGNQIDTTVTLAKILAKGEDSKRFKSSQYVCLTGYVILVKEGGLETCNCHGFKDIEHKEPMTKDEQKQVEDIHIELAMKLSDGATQAVIVEINRFTKLIHPEYTVANLKKLLLNQKVTLEGWMFFDEEHTQNAVNTNQTGTNLWRATCWEVHPVLIINIIK